MMESHAPSHPGCESFIIYAIYSMAGERARERDRDRERCYVHISVIIVYYYDCSFYHVIIVNLQQCLIYKLN